MKRVAVSLGKGEVFAILDALDAESSKLEQDPPPKGRVRAHFLICSHLLVRIMDTIPKSWGDEWEES